MADAGLFGSFRALLDAGYSQESIVEAALADDLSLLQHSAPYRVQLQDPEGNDE